MSRAILRIVLAMVCLSATLMTANTAEEAYAKARKVRGRRSDDGGPLEAVVQQLSQKVTDLTAQLTQQGTEIAALKARAATLEKTVAFHASSGTYQLQVASHGTIVLNVVSTNVGNAYDPLTGVFTVPVTGLYDVQLTYMADYPARNQYYATIMVDGRGTNAMISDSQHGYWDTVTARVLLHLTAGQKVYAVNQNAGLVGYHGPFSSFSGFLISADQ